MTVRPYALDFLARATNGAKGVARGDAPYERVTEGRHTQAVKSGLFYSACGDLAQALLFACGIRSKSFINRAENGSISGDPYKAGWNVAELDALAFALKGLRPYVDKYPAPTMVEVERLLPGDVCIVWNQADTRDAHVLAVRDASGWALGELDTAEYGQGGVPHDGKQATRRVAQSVSNVFIGTRKLQRIIKLDEAVQRYATAEPIPLDTYFGPVQTMTNIEALQTLLNERGAKLVVDGKFGPKSKAALRAFLGPAAWGVVEDKTR